MVKQKISGSIAGKMVKYKMGDSNAGKMVKQKKGEILSRDGEMLMRLVKSQIKMMKYYPDMVKC